MPMGNSDSSHQLQFIVKYRHHRSPIEIPADATILQLKTQIASLSDDHPKPDEQRIIGLVKDLRRDVSDDMQVGACDAVKEGKKNLIQVLKIKSRSEREREQQHEKNVKLQQKLQQSHPLTPQQIAENKFIKVREVLQQSSQQLENYKTLCPEREKQVKFLKGIDEHLLKQMLHLDALEICNNEEDYRMRRKELLREIQQLQDRLDAEMGKI